MAAAASVVEDSKVRRKFQPPVDWLAEKILNDAVWGDAFQRAIDEAQKHGVEIIRSIRVPEDFLVFAEKLLTEPFLSERHRDETNALLGVDFILNQEPLMSWQSRVEPKDKPKKLTELSEWMVRYIQSLGSYMDSPESVREIPKLVAFLDHQSDEYMAPPSGYYTLNQFFARHVKPGARPIAGLKDDRVIVSPADSTFVGWWKIHPKSDTNPGGHIKIKGLEWSIHQLLEDSEYKDAFAGGIFTHSLLKEHNYHRFHAPTAGKVLEKKNIQGQCYMDIVVEDGIDNKKVLNLVGGTGFQFVQTRGLIVLDSPIGLVGCIPVGMSHVSSVVLTPDVGVYLHKGEELGYFQFGGSDFVMIFQKQACVELACAIGVEYPVGSAVGKSHSFVEI